MKYVLKKLLINFLTTVILKFIIDKWLAIICCFIGAGVVPGISVKLKDGNDQTEKNDISTSPSL